MSRHITGPGGPFDFHGVVIDTRGACLLSDTTAALTEFAGQDAIALDLGGPVAHTHGSAHTARLHLLNAEAAAAVVFELQRAVGHTPTSWQAAYRAALGKCSRDYHLELLKEAGK